MYLTRTAGIETLGFSLLCRILLMYLTRTAGIETPARRAWRSIAAQCILPALRELKPQSWILIGIQMQMYLTRTAGIET